jgi:uncharacterized membrane protein
VEKMDKKIYLILIAIFALSLAAGAGASSAADRSYSIPYINMDLFLQNDGTLHVKETIHYSFTGTYHRTYRFIPIKDQQLLTNIKVSTPGVYSDFNVTDQGSKKNITVNLYSDPQKTTPITDRDVDVILEYDFLHVIRFYNDVAELQYKLVGEDWEVDIGKVNANIHLQSSDGVKYWLNPPYFVENSSWQGSTLQITSKTIPKGDYFELTMVIPKSQFAANASNGLIINQDGLSAIEKIQNDYQNGLNFYSNLYSILAVLLLLLAVFVPLIIYLLYGREPKIQYRAEYERDIPTDDPPAIVNAICGPGFSKKVGEPDMDGFKATIMDLIDQQYLFLVTKPSGKKGSDSGSIYFKVNPEKDPAHLQKFELDVLKFLKRRRYEKNGLISLDRISEDLKDREGAGYFRDTYNDWKDDIKGKFLTDETLKKIFIKKGDTYLKIFGVLGLITAVIVFFMALFSPLPPARYALFASIILGLVSIVSLRLPEKIAGQWTTYGEEYDAKWHNFKKYIKDFSLIKEYPPESVKIWNRYLVYATALGAADAVIKAMKLAVPSDELEGSDVYMFHNYGGYGDMSSSFDSGMSTGTGSDGFGGGGFGGFGDVGGGDGGGGGGAD